MLTLPERCAPRRNDAHPTRADPLCSDGSARAPRATSRSALIGSDKLPSWWTRPGERDPELVRVLESAARLQQVVPDAVLVGGSAAAMYAGHRRSYDQDHVLPDLRERFDAVLEAIENEDGWVTNRVTPGKVILGRPRRHRSRGQADDPKHAAERWPRSCCHRGASCGRRPRTKPSGSKGSSSFAAIKRGTSWTSWHWQIGISGTFRSMLAAIDTYTPISVAR